MGLGRGWLARLAQGLWFDAGCGDGWGWRIAPDGAQCPQFGRHAEAGGGGSGPAGGQAIAPL